MDEIRLEGKLVRTWIRGKDFKNGKPNLWDEAEILVSPLELLEQIPHRQISEILSLINLPAPQKPTSEQLASLKEGDEVLVRAKVKENNVDLAEIIIEGREIVIHKGKSIIAIFPQQPAEEYCDCELKGKYIWDRICMNCKLPMKPFPPKPKQFPISACCNASVNEFITGKYICDVCKEICELVDWNKPKQEELREVLNKLLDDTVAIDDEGIFIDQAITAILKDYIKKDEIEVVDKLKNIEWDCFYRGSFYGCYYYSNSGTVKSKEYIGKSLFEALNKMLEDIDLPSPPEIKE